jgi:type I restriction enzyme S subunit
MEYAILQKGFYVQVANRTTIPNLSASRLKEFIVPFPNLSEQQQIASILSTVDEKIASEEQKKQSLQEVFNSLLKNLMTGKIRVNELQVA